MEYLRPMRIMGPVECRVCGNTMSVITTEVNATHLDSNGRAFDISGLIFESYLLCDKCGFTAFYEVNPKTREYSILNGGTHSIDNIDRSLNNVSKVPDSENPFQIFEF